MDLELLKIYHPIILGKSVYRLHFHAFVGIQFPAVVTLSWRQSSPCGGLNPQRQQEVQGGARVLSRWVGRAGGGGSALGVREARPVPAPAGLLLPPPPRAGRRGSGGRRPRAWSSGSCPAAGPRAPRPLRERPAWPPPIPGQGGAGGPGARSGPQPGHARPASSPGSPGEASVQVICPFFRRIVCFSVLSSVSSS